MLDIVQILRRNRFLVFAENARREILQSPPLCLPGFADRPPKVFAFAAIATTLVTLIRGSALPRVEFASRNRVKKFLRLADRRLDPKGLLSPYLYAGTGATRLPLGRGRTQGY